MAPEYEMDDGRVFRGNPRTGRGTVTSAADAARTKLTRERDTELSMQAGAPPIAKGPPQFSGTAQPTAAPAASTRYQGANRDLNVARAKADGQFDSMRTNFNATSKTTEMDEAGTILPRATPSGPAAQPAPPQFNERDLSDVAVAAGPNISTAATGLPQGSTGYARADGTYAVRTADGQTQTFANEQAARTNFAKVAARPQAMQSAQAFLANRPATPAAPASPPPPAIPRQDAAPDAASQAWAANSAGRFAAQDAARAPAPAMPAAPAPATAAAPSFAQMQAQALPVAPVAAPPAVAAVPAPAAPAAPHMNAAPSPLLQSVVVAATAAPQPVATPTNAPQFSAPASSGVDAARSRNADASQAKNTAFNKRIATFGQMTPEEQAASETKRKERVTARRDSIPLPMRDGQGRPVDARVPRSALETDRDASSVMPSRPPLFGEDEPGAFPTLSGSAGASRPRASLA